MGKSRSGRLRTILGHMAALTRQPNVHGHIGDVSTTRGAVSIMLTDNPTLWQPPMFRTYVALARWLPADRPVAMFVTFMAISDRREINLIFAPEDVRFDPTYDGDVSVPVQIGRWLFSENHLTHHSVDRTPGGDGWAKSVGGVLPPLASTEDPHRGNPEATLRSAERAYTALCATNWEGCWSIG